MKKVLLLSAIALTSCGKIKFENRIQGSWKMTEIKLNWMESWNPMPITEDSVIITDSHISNPWNKPYTTSGKTIIMNNDVIKVDVKKHDMLWVFSNTDSLRFER